MTRKRMRKWTRLDCDCIHNPKIATLTDSQHRNWIRCLCICDDTGKLPRIKHVAHHFRLNTHDAEVALHDLVEAELLDPIMGPTGQVNAYQLHDWNDYHYASYSSTERMRKHRSKKKDADGVTSPKRHSDALHTEQTDKNLIYNKIQKQPAAETGRDLDLDLEGQEGDLSGSSKDLQRIIRIAEGFGLPIDELNEVANAAKPKNPEAYFATLCAARLQGIVPTIKPELIKAALAGKDDAIKLIMQAMVAS